MNFLEKDLENLIIDTDKNKLLENGLYIGNKKIRQLNLGANGILDIVSYEKRYDNTNKVPVIYIRIYELKRDTVCMNTIKQLSRYYLAVSEYVKSRYLKSEGLFTFQINLVLIGSNFNFNDSNFITSAFLIKNLEIFTYSLQNKNIFFTKVDLEKVYRKSLKIK
jgi:hypothetical protein